MRMTLLVLILLGGCYDAATVAPVCQPTDADAGTIEPPVSVHYEAVVDLHDYAGAVDACASLGGELAQIDGPESMRAIVEACSAGGASTVPPSWVGCWT